RGPARCEPAGRRHADRRRRADPGLQAQRPRRPRDRRADRAAFAMSAELEGWAAARGLEVSADGRLRELTPALIQGSRGSVSSLVHGRLADGLDGTLAHHTFADGVRRRESTVVVTAVPEGAAFAPALVCRDRGELGSGIPAQLPAERWHGTVLESTVFNRRYRLLTLAGQDPIYVRELFSPSLIAWLAHDV